MTKEFTKGTWHRPLRVPKEEFESNWDKIFKASKDREVEVPINQAKNIPWRDAEEGYGFVQDIDKV